MVERDGVTIPGRIPGSTFQLMILFKIAVWWDVMFSRSLEDIYIFFGGETITS